MRFYESLPQNPTRDQLDRTIQMAISRLCIGMGMNLTPDRMAIIIQHLQGQGFSVRQLENAIVALATCPKFDEKLRYGGTLTPADILEKAREVSTPVAVDPVRAMLDREKRQKQTEMRLLNE